MSSSSFSIIEIFYNILFLFEVSYFIHDDYQQRQMVGIIFFQSQMEDYGWNDTLTIASCNILCESRQKDLQDAVDLHR